MPSPSRCGVYRDRPGAVGAGAEREAIIVNPGGDALYFCKAHFIPAFVTAFHIARNGGQSGIFLPTLGGTFIVTPSDSQLHLLASQTPLRRPMQHRAAASHRRMHPPQARARLQRERPGRREVTAHASPGRP
jgi:hypothetical protein